ncbi:GNAT family N-acetyltransferase [Georgenia sp. Z1491]|uniref:GNAT family N-acetyltransferase n=1 Tax=Georgenia sp. Z1491 TaxID=3416707 RepID=UPI003CE74D7B
MTNHVLVAGQVPTVRDDPDHGRYVVEVSHVRIGRIDYHLHGRMMAMVRTEVHPDRETPGLTELLVDGALDDVRARDLRVLPYCPVVRGIIDAERERRLDLVPRAIRGEFFDVEDEARLA